MEIIMIGIGVIGGIVLGILNLGVPNISPIFFYAPIIYLLGGVNPLIGISIILSNIGLNIVWNFITWETPNELTNDPLLQKILLTENNKGNKEIKGLMRNKVNGYITAVIFSYILFNINLIGILKLSIFLLPIGFLIALFFVYILYTESKDKTLAMIALIGSLGVAIVVILSGYKDPNIIMTLVTALFSIGGTIELLTNPKGYYSSLNNKGSLDLPSSSTLNSNGRLIRSRSSRGSKSKSSTTNNNKSSSSNSNSNSNRDNKKGEGIKGIIAGVISSIFIGITCSSIYAYLTNNTNNNNKNTKEKNKENKEKIENYMYAKGISEGMGFILMIFGLGERDAAAGLLSPIISTLNSTPIITFILIVLFSILFAVLTFNYVRDIYVIRKKNEKGGKDRRGGIKKGLVGQIVVLFVPYIVSMNVLSLLIPVILIIWAIIFNRLITNSGLSRSFSTSVLSFIPLIGIMGLG